MRPRRSARIADVGVCHAPAHQGPCPRACVAAGFGVPQGPIWSRLVDDAPSEEPERGGAFGAAKGPQAGGGWRSQDKEEGRAWGQPGTSPTEGQNRRHESFEAKASSPGDSARPQRWDASKVGGNAADTWRGTGAAAPGATAPTRDGWKSYDRWGSAVGGEDRSAAGAPGRRPWGESESGTHEWRQTERQNGGGECFCGLRLVGWQARRAWCARACGSSCLLCNLALLEPF